MALAASPCVSRPCLIMKSVIFAQYNLFGANVYMCYDYVHLGNLSDITISAYRNHNIFLCPVPKSALVARCLAMYRDPLKGPIQLLTKWYSL